ncbi:hypothetical protein WJX81_004151 [Elliptochloris bilobata]|uniref:Uncharacterized protein n=1 Tax=Elliptochloris bilobata TaxID=381761 RepID=A0AAW1SBU3_9CHLO
MPGAEGAAAAAGTRANKPHGQHDSAALRAAACAKAASITKGACDRMSPRSAHRLKEPFLPICHSTTENTTRSGGAKKALNSLKRALCCLRPKVAPDELPATGPAAGTGVPAQTSPTLLPGPKSWT